MNKYLRTLSIAALFSASILPVAARQLTPGEALDRVMADAPAKVKGLTDKSTVKHFNDTGSFPTKKSRTKESTTELAPAMLRAAEMTEQKYFACASIDFRIGLARS